MTYFCNMCDKTIKYKSKNKDFNSNAHKIFDRCKHKKINT